MEFLTKDPAKAMRWVRSQMHRFLIPLFVYFWIAVRPAAAQVRVTMVEAMKSAVTSPPPEYAPLAKQAHIVGDVVVEVKISPEGDVTEVQAVSGNTLLANPVLKTLRMWKFKPFQSEGKATAAVTNLRFSFKQ
jgi:TonB family protein